MLSAQPNIRIEPLNWWVGMRNPELQLMVYAKDIALSDVKIKHSGIELVKVNKVSNPNYLFLDIRIGKKAKAGKFDIVFTPTDGNAFTYTFELLDRREDSANRTGFTNADVLYLIMPDRFANGDPANDNMPDYEDKLNRKDLFGRHGGDIKGIIDHLDYITDLGVTTLWLNPVLENRQPKASYHGYAITDFYKVDPRHGSNELYREMVQKAHEKGLKVIMDMVFNHCGDKHWWISDLPSDDWLNQWQEFTRSNYKATTHSDPHASSYDHRKMSRGWFDNTMPDLNQDNPFLARYLIQNSIWWTEYADLDGIRMDTHPYPEKGFMSRWAKEVMTEYPNYNIVAEAWFNITPLCAYWQKGVPNSDGYDSNVPTVMDFPLMFALNEAFDVTQTWDKGLIQLYDILALDYLYQNSDNILVFADNHDLSRFNRKEDKTTNRYKMIMSFLMTTRGIPQIYYGTELMMTGLKSDGDGALRRDFPGGWKGDVRSAFDKKGRSEKENDVWNFTQKLLQWRRTSVAVQKGKLMHFIPEDNFYVYFRYTETQRVMVILNNNNTSKNLKTDRFEEMLKGYTKGTEILTGKVLEKLDVLTLTPRSAMIIELSQ